MPDWKWRAVGVSLQGTAHVAAGLPCQDAHVCQTLPTGELIMVLADGAGSAACASEGSQAAALAAARALAAGLAAAPRGPGTAHTAVVRAAYAAARDELAGLARAAERPLRDYATTLTCLAAGADWLVSGQLGDGLAVSESEGGLALVARPQRGEYANEAYFLTMPAALEYVEVGVCREPVQAIAASTDGLLRLALQLPGYEPFGPFFRPLFAFVAAANGASVAQQQLVRFLDGPRVCARTDDDKTLVLAVRVPAGAVLPQVLALPEPGLAEAG